MAAMRDTAVDRPGTLDAMSRQWDAIHQQADEVARLAGLSIEPCSTERAAFPILLAEAHEWQRGVVERGLEDVDAMMRLGLTALGAVTARGQDASAPALALWREFHHAREAMLFALLPQPKAA